MCLCAVSQSSSVQRLIGFQPLLSASGTCRARSFHHNSSPCLLFFLRFLMPEVFTKYMISCGCLSDVFMVLYCFFLNLFLLLFFVALRPLQPKVLLSWCQWHHLLWPADYPNRVSHNWQGDYLDLFLPIQLTPQHLPSLCRYLVVFLVASSWFPFACGIPKYL